MKSIMNALLRISMNISRESYKMVEIPGKNVDPGGFDKMKKSKILNLKKKK